MPRKSKSIQGKKTQIQTSQETDNENEAIQVGEEDTPIVITDDIEVLPAEALVPEDAKDIEDDEVESKQGLVRYDSLNAYLQEIKKYKPLTREEEHDLAVRYFTNKDLEAAYKLVSSNLWLVVKFAREYEKAARTMLDLVQEGNIGLMEAIRNFDPYRGVRFPSYAVWWIKAYIIRYVMANWRMVKIGTTQAQRKLFFNLKKEKERLEREGFYPGPKLLAEKLQVKEHEIVEMEQRLGSADMSVDAPVDQDGEANLLSVLPADQLNAEDLLSKRQSQELLTQSLDDFASTLNEKELIIFKQRMLGEEKATLQEIADKLSLSKERVRQLEERIKSNLKKYITNKLGDDITSVDFN